MAAYAFSIKRGGILYGTVGESGDVLVEAIYEPPQVWLGLPCTGNAPAACGRCPALEGNASWCVYVLMWRALCVFRLFTVYAHSEMSHAKQRMTVC